jgi:hypothetical protein
MCSGSSLSSFFSAAASSVSTLTRPSRRRPLTPKDPRPLEHTGPLNAVLGQARRVRNRADGKDGLPRQHVEAALVAGRERRENEARLSLEALGAAVDERLERVRVVGVDHIDERGVDPAPCLDLGSEQSARQRKGPA